jgi:hypothetical protein
MPRGDASRDFWCGVFFAKSFRAVHVERARDKIARDFTRGDIATSLC